MKTLFRILLWSPLVLVLLVVIVTAVFEDRIGKLVLGQVNEQFGTTIEAQRFGLSLWRHFPAVGGELEGVRVAGAFGEPLLVAETAGFELPYSVLWGGEVALNTLYLEDCTLRIVFDERGRANYDIFDTTKGEQPATAGRIGIRRARFDNVRLRYDHAQLDQHADLLIETGEASGDFGATDFLLASEAELRSYEVRLEDTRYLLDKAVRYRTKLAVDTEAGTYRLRDTHVAVEDNAFRVAGEIETAAQHTRFDLEYASEAAELGRVLRLLPPPYSDYLRDVDSDGVFTVSGTVEGRLSATEQPALQANLTLEDGSLGTGLFDAALSDIAFAATYTNGAERNARTSKLTVDNFRGRIGEERIALDLAVQNFDDPYLNLRANGAADIAPLGEVLDLPGLAGAGGVLVVDDLRVKGRYARLFDPARISGVDMSGILTADDLRITYHDKPLGIRSGRVTLANNRVTLDALRLYGQESDLTLRGTVDNLLPVLLADSLNSKKATLRLDLTADARRLDLDNLFHLADLSGSDTTFVSKGAQTAANTARRTELTKLLRGKIEANAAAFAYEQLTGEDFRGEVRFERDRFLLRGETVAMGGTYALDGTLDLRAAPHLHAQVKGLDVDAHTLFEQAENFGQTFLEARHLDGRLRGHAVIDAYWDTEGAFRYDDLEVAAVLRILDGNLKDFALLENFEDYIDGGTLRDVHFTDLNGFLRIRRGEVFLCKTFIQTNAANLHVSGRHGFDQRFQYFMRVNAGQVAANLLFKKYKGDRPLPDRSSGLFNFHYVVEGDVDDFTYGTDKSRVKKAFERSVVVQRQVKKVLKKAYPNLTFTAPAAAGVAPRASVPPIRENEEEYLDF